MEQKSALRDLKLKLKNMKYNLDWLKAKYDKNEAIDYVFFWGHQPRKDGQIGKTCMSQWWENTAFEVDGIRYTTAEHWMMAEKARLFNDEAILVEILKTESPATAKKLGRKIRGFVPEIWEANSFDIVTKGSFHKFNQNKKLKAYLLNTGDKVIVEASPYDGIWGIGLIEKTPNIENPHTWYGTNLLGFALMTARSLLV